MIPSTKIQVNDALNETISLFDHIHVDIDNQTISGLVKLPFEPEPIQVKYPLKLTLSSGDYPKNDPQVLFD